MLSSYRVLDLTDERGQLAAEILCSLGADVVLVEPPGGSPVRMQAPFVADQPGLERSLTFWGWNRGKRSVVIDLGTATGRLELRELALRCDVILESGAVAIDLADLRRANPALVTVSISAFGSTGPKADWPATDLTVLAAGGQLVLTGDSDRPPVRTTLPQAFLHAAGDAARGALMALAERAESGLGQHVDVSAQRSVLFATQSHVLAAPYGASLFHRMSGGHRIGGIDVRMTWPCQDGHVVVMLLFGASFGPYTGRLMAWVHEEGHCDETVRDKDWRSYGGRLFGGKESVEGYEGIKSAVGALCLNHTKDELLQGAIDRRLLIAPIATAADVALSPQLAARDYWDLVDDPKLGPSRVRAPGAFVRSSALPRRTLGPAPRLDEHGETVLSHWSQPIAPIIVSTAPRRPPLDGLRVVDITWALSGPATARALSDFGATVVHIESSHRVDAARTVQPFLLDHTGSENAAVYLNMNVGKLGLSLNLGCPEGRTVLDDLVAWADVLIESFSPRGRRALGLDYDRLAALKPGLIMMSSCLFGQDGPLESYAGFGGMAAALSGFYDLTGWPDRAPAGPFGAYTDYVSPRFAVCALLAALEHRRRTGQGQYLDFAQAEAAVHFLTPALLDYTVNARVAGRRGNDDPVMAPHGVFPCAGHDRWVAIACRDDADWRTLASIVSRPDLAGLDEQERRNRRDALDVVITEWTAPRSPGEVEQTLIAHGVPAHAVQHSPECADDSQLRHQGHFAPVSHAEHGSVIVERSRVVLSDTPARIDRGAPVLGQDTVEVLTRLLGYDEERLGLLFAAGALD